jgi:hypothetical protein
VDIRLRWFFNATENSAVEFDCDVDDYFSHFRFVYN